MYTPPLPRFLDADAVSANKILNVHFTPDSYAIAEGLTSKIRGFVDPQELLDITAASALGMEIDPIAEGTFLSKRTVKHRLEDIAYSDGLPNKTTAVVDYAFRIGMIAVRRTSPGRRDAWRVGHSFDTQDKEVLRDVARGLSDHALATRFGVDYQAARSLQRRVRRNLNVHKMPLAVTVGHHLGILGVRASNNQLHPALSGV